MAKRDWSRGINSCQLVKGYTFLPAGPFELPPSPYQRNLFVCSKGNKQNINIMVKHRRMRRLYVGFSNWHIEEYLFLANNTVSFWYFNCSAPGAPCRHFLLSTAAQHLPCFAATALCLPPRAPVLFGAKLCVPAFFLILAKHVTLVGMENLLLNAIM